MRIDQTFSMDRWDVMRAFLAQHYRPDLALCSRKIYEWQFQVPAHGGAACMLCVWDVDKLAGIHGYVPVDLFWGDLQRSISGVWGANWMVAPDYRHGIGWLLLRKLQEMFPVMLSLDANANNLQIVEKMNWRVFPRIPRYLIVLDLVKAIPMLGAEASEDDLRPLLFQPAASPAARVGDLALDASRYAPDWTCYPPMAYGTVRSMAYLKWRYLDSPSFCYRLFAEGPRHRPAVCVCRIERAFGSHEALVGRFVEFFHPDDAAGKRDGMNLLRAVLGMLKDRGCVYADFFGSSRRYAETMLEAGWGEEPSDRQILPHRLAPVEYQNRHLNLEYGVAPDLAQPRLEEMYITKSDSDADRLSRLPELLPQSVDLKYL